MSEIISIGIGQTGIATNFQHIQNICREHNVNPEGFKDQTNENEHMKVMFEEVAEKRYVPRLIKVTNSQIEGSIDAIWSHEYSNLVVQSSICCGQDGSGGLWAKGRYLDEANQIVDQASDVIRKQIERCNRFLGFQITSSLIGGTGSGTSSLLLQRLREDYCPDIVSASVYLPHEFDGNPVGVYNSILTMNQLIENTDKVTCYDNQAITKQLNYTQTKFSDINQIVANCLSIETASSRFGGLQNSNLRKQAVNLVPFPRLHFFIPIYANKTLKSMEEKFNYLHSPNNYLLTTNKEKCGLDYSIYTCALTFLGSQISTFEVDDGIKVQRRKYPLHYVPWIPDNYHQSIVNNHPSNDSLMIMNSRQILTNFQRQSQIFENMFRRKAFVFHYTNFGQDEMEFTEAESNFSDLISEYQPYNMIDEEEEIDYEVGH